MAKFDLHRLLSAIADKPHKDKKLSVVIDKMSSTKFINFVTSLDSKIYLALYKESRPVFFRKIMYLFSRLGDGYMWLVLAMLLIIFKKPAPYIYLMRAITSSIISITLFTYLKNLVNRMRPYIKHNVTPILEPPDRYSFPSGHSMIASSIVVTFGTQSPFVFVLCAVFGCCIAISRVFTGVHYPFDVLISIVVGIGIGIGTNYAFYYIFDMPLFGFQKIV